MKKILAALLTVCMLLTAAVSMAEGAAVTEVNWSDLEAGAAEYQGALTPIADTGVQMFVPAFLTVEELTQEQVDGGLALSLVDAEHTMGVTVQVVKVDLQSFVNDAMSKGGQGFKELKVNGMQSINFNMVNEEGLVTTCFAFSAGGGSATFLFSFAPANEQTAGLFRVMAGSIQPVQ